jgi:hypothetical protein
VIITCSGTSGTGPHRQFTTRAHTTQAATVLGIAAALFATATATAVTTILTS